MWRVVNEALQWRKCNKHFPTPLKTQNIISDICNILLGRIDINLIFSNYNEKQGYQPVLKKKKKVS